jgi:hypothetical protein
MPEEQNENGQVIKRETTEVLDTNGNTLDTSTAKSLSSMFDSIAEGKNEGKSSKEVVREVQAKGPTADKKPEAAKPAPVEKPAPKAEEKTETSKPEDKKEPEKKEEEVSRESLRKKFDEIGQK